MDFEAYALNLNKRFILSKRKKQEKFADIIMSEATSRLEDWRHSLVESLSDPLDPRSKHRLRYPRTRLFPYMNSGALAETIWFSVDKHITDKSVVVNITVNNLSSSDIENKPNNTGEKHAWFTTNGLREPKKASAGNWRGWVYDVFQGSGRGDVASLKDIFNQLHKTRRAI